MIRKILGITLFSGIALLSIFLCLGCVSSGAAQKQESAATPKPTPTEEPLSATVEITEAPTAQPTAAPTPKPTALPKVPGSGWMVPEQINATVGQKFMTEVHINTGDKQKVAAYGFTVTYDKNVIAVDSQAGNNGVEAGPQGFVNAINATVAGQIKIAGFDVYGKDPGANLSFVVIHWAAKAAGSTEIKLVVSNINDNNGVAIGKPEGSGASVNVK